MSAMILCRKSWSHSASLPRSIMNLVWIVVILVALAVCLGIFVVAGGAILYLTKGKPWWLRALLICVPGIVLFFLLNAWLGPHELTDKKELAARFELVFRFAPEPFATDIRYQLNDGPDDMGEWFRFRTDAPTLERLAPDLQRISSRAFGEASSRGPDWWLAQPTEALAYYRGSIPTTAGASPHSRQVWIAHDRAQHLVYCYIHSLL